MLVLACSYASLGLCDSTLTLVVPSGPLMVADKHNWSREVTCGPLDCSWSHDISSWGLGRSQQSLLDCWAIAGFHREPWAIAVCSLGTWAIAVWTPGSLGDRSLCSWKPGRSQSLLLEAWAIAGFAPGSLGDRRLAPEDLGDRRIPPGLLLVAPFALWSPHMLIWSPLSLSGRPFLLFFCLRSTYEGCTLLPRVHHVCHVIIGYFWV